jgi:chorismate mutase
VAGHAGRDRAREDEIVARMARVAPSLGEDRLRRIMQQVIAESLDAAETGPSAGEQPPAP